MDGPADTLVYFIAGYLEIFVIILVYLASIFIRWRNLCQESVLLQELQPQEPSSGE